MRWWWTGRGVWCCVRWRWGCRRDLLHLLASAFQLDCRPLQFLRHYLPDRVHLHVDPYRIAGVTHPDPMTAEIKSRVAQLCHGVLGKKQGNRVTILAEENEPE